jgi:Mrp family chromosome partitioning ATPase
VKTVPGARGAGDADGHSDLSVRLKDLSTRLKAELETTEQTLEPKLLDSVVRQLLFLSEPARGQVVGITSAIGGEGKTSIADALGRRLANCVSQDSYVLLVDCAQPSGLVHRAPADPPRSGNRFEGERTLVYHTMRALEVNHAPIHLSGLATALDDLRARHPFVVLDLPALLTDPVGTEIARAVDKLYLVVRAGSTSTHAIKQAVAQIGHDRVDGVILNGVRPSLPVWLGRLLS